MNTNDFSGNYFIKNLVNNIHYVGKSKTCLSRWNDHIEFLNAGRADKENAALLADWQKYGQKNFEWGILRKSDPSELEYEIDINNRFYELDYVYNIYPKMGIETYTKKSDHDYLLYKNLKWFREVMSKQNCRVISVQWYLDGNTREKCKPDILWVDDDTDVLHCLDMHDPIDEPGKEGINTYTKHKKYCEGKGINFFNYDPRRLDPNFKPEPSKPIVFSITVGDDFNIKP